MKPSSSGTEEIGLVNGLWSTNITQFWWTIGCAHNHGHVALMSFHNCAKKMCRSGSGRTQQDGWHLRRETDTYSCK
jgi:hypothetical protein